MPRFTAILLCMTLCTIAGSGCQSVPDPEGDPRQGRNREAEPNNAFADATPLALETDDSALITGEIRLPDDIDLFDLGRADAGDSVGVTVMRTTSSFASAIALYDASGNLINSNIDASISDSAADPALTHVVRESTDQLFLGISHNSVRQSVGSYEIDVQFERGGEAPGVLAPPQIVLLNFEAGEVLDPVFGLLEFDRFNARDINETYGGQTREVKDAIIATFNQNYERFDIIIRDTDRQVAPNRDFTEVFFGGFSELAFAVAEEVDPYNQNPGDHAVIFTESFQPELFIGTPTAEGLGVAIGNVASHEVGHVLGLNHVIDPSAIMDERSPAFTLLFDQEFKIGPLSSQIFAVGRQDAPGLLAVTLGLIPDLDVQASRLVSISWPGFDSGQLSHTDALEMFFDLLEGGLIRKDSVFRPDGELPSKPKCHNCMVRAQHDHALGALAR